MKKLKNPGPKSPDEPKPLLKKSVKKKRKGESVDVPVKIKRVVDMGSDSEDSKPVHLNHDYTVFSDSGSIVKLINHNHSEGATNAHDDMKHKSQSIGEALARTLGQRAMT